MESIKIALIFVEKFLLVIMILTVLMPMGMESVVSRMGDNNR